MLDGVVSVAEESFYVAGGFWLALAGGVVALAIGLLTIWITWRVANPKRRLLYGMPVEMPLLNMSTRHGLEIRRDNQILVDPHVVKVTLRNEGRLDITSRSFDRDRPLTLDVGVKILDVLEVTTSKAYAVPIYYVAKTALKIGPDLIGRGQHLSFSLLVDGQRPRLTCPPPHPIDIQIDELKQLERRITKSSAGVSLFSFAAFIASAIVANLIKAQPIRLTLSIVAVIAMVMTIVPLFWTGIRLGSHYSQET